VRQRRCLGCGTLTRSGPRCGNCKRRQKAPYTTTEYQRNRQIVLERDGYVCQLKRPGCEGRATEADHTVPHSRGGGNAPHEMQAACKHCNSGKRDR
jgi:5-methylcytosine-specific restriction endonuclease McrA